MTKQTDPSGAPPPSPLWVTGAFVGAIIGGFTVAVIGKSQWVTTNITYTDLAAVLLAAVTLILALFGFVLAAAAIYGYRELQQMIERRADKATQEYLDNYAVKILEKRANEYLARRGDIDDEFDEEDRAFMEERERSLRNREKNG
jgi:hypothetical protein